MFTFEKFTIPLLTLGTHLVSSSMVNYGSKCLCAFDHESIRRTNCITILYIEEIREENTDQILIQRINQLERECFN